MTLLPANRCFIKYLKIENEFEAEVEVEFENEIEVEVKKTVTLSLSKWFLKAQPNKLFK